MAGAFDDVIVTPREYGAGNEQQQARAEQRYTVEYYVMEHGMGLPSNADQGLAPGVASPQPAAQ